MVGTTYKYNWDVVMPQVISKLKNSSLSIEKVCQDLKVSPISTRKRLRALGHQEFFDRNIGRQNTLTEENWETIKECLKNKKSVSEISRILQKPVTTLRSAIQRKKIPLTFRTYRYEDAIFLPALAELETNSNLSLNQASKKYQISLVALIRFLKEKNRQDLIRRHRKIKGISKLPTHGHHFVEKVIGPELVEKVIGPELGIVFLHRRTQEWVLTIPPYYVLGQTPSGIQKIKIKVLENETPIKAFNRQFKPLRFFTPNLETLAEYWKVPIEQLLMTLDQHSQEYLNKLNAIKLNLELNK